MPTRHHARSAGRAFVLAEAAGVVVILAILAAVLCISTGDARRRSRLAGSIANLQHYAAGTSAYAADNDNRVWTFTWRAGDNLSHYPDLNGATSDNQAAANQAVDILRRRAGRLDIAPITGWVPNILYSHLVLNDYLDQPLPTKTIASPEDVNRLAWQRDPLNYFNLPNRPNFPTADNANKRWPYSSSYELGAPFFSRDAGTSQGQTVQQDSNDHHYYYVGTLPMGDRRLTQVAFPSQKAMVYEQFQRFFGSRVVYGAYDEARVPILFADGSVGVRATNDSNLGFIPNSPTNPNPFRGYYYPDPNYEPPTLNGVSAELVTGHYRWTKPGLRGRDFGGPEVPYPPP
jgi:Tfp pilus assembly protein PilE